MGMMRPVLRRGGRVAEGAPLLRSTPQKGVGVRIPFSAILRSRVLILASACFQMESATAKCLTIIVYSL